MEETTPTFGIADYIVLVLVLLVSSAIGIYYRFTGGKQKTTQEYLLADRNMHIAPVAFSLMASFMSAITLLGVSSENYMFGTQFIVINISYGIFTPVAAYLYLPVFFNLQAASAYEYLEKRFGKTARLTASLAYTLQMVLYMGIVLYAPALALEALTGISKEAAILIIGIVCTFYSTIGGMKAVLMTDVFQSVLMFVAIFCVIIVGAVQAGGLDEIWKIAEKGNRLEFLNFKVDPTERHTWWSLIIGGGFTYLSLYAVSQTQVQRYMTVRDLKTAQKALWLNWPILTALSLTTSFSGLAIYSKYHNCDPYTQGKISKPDQLMPYFVLDTMGGLPGVSGLFVAGIFSASLSTVSAALNSLAAITFEDYIKPIYKNVKKSSISESYSGWLVKVLALLYGVLCIGLAFLSQFLGGVLQASLTIFGVVGGPLLGLFTAGMFTTVANETGSLIGLALGLSFGLWLGFGGPKPPPPYLNLSTEGCNETSYMNFHNMIVENRQNSINNFSLAEELKHLKTAEFSYQDEESTYFYLYRLSYLWNIVLGFLITFIVGVIASMIINLIKPNEKQMKMDPNLFVPPLAYILRKKQTRKMSFGSQTSSVLSELKKIPDFVSPGKNHMITNL